MPPSTRATAAGALVNIHGELIGINTVLRSTSGGSQGVGFAIPVNKAKKVVQQITEYGSVVPPYLAMEVQTITEELAEKVGNADEYRGFGVRHRETESYRECRY